MSQFCVFSLIVIFLQFMTMTFLPRVETTQYKGDGQQLIDLDKLISIVRTIVDSKKLQNNLEYSMNTRKRRDADEPSSETEKTDTNDDVILNVNETLKKVPENSSEILSSEDETYLKRQISSGPKNDYENIANWLNITNNKTYNAFVEDVAMKTCDILNQYSSFPINCAVVKNRIVGGEPIQIENYPFIAHYNGNCGSSIISRRWIITAAHCLEVGNSVRVGHTYAGRGALYKIKRHITHPYYNPSDSVAFDYDFQLLELEKPLVYGSKVQPIQIGKPSDIVPGSLATVLGWGAVKEGATSGSPSLMATVVPIIINKSCRNAANGHFVDFITDRMLCAGYQSGGKDACQGDSGGPLVYNNRLIGLVSFGIGCGRPNFPGVYARIPAIRSWIRSHVLVKSPK